MLFAKASSTRPAAKQGLAGGTAATMRMLSMQAVDMRTVPAIGSGISVKSAPALRMPGENQAVADQLQKNLQHNPNIPRSGIPQKAPPTTVRINASTPGTRNNFQGLADSTSVCPPLSCQPPDMAIASSPSWIFQGVNTSFAVYSPTGQIQSGWPIAARNF